METQHLSFDATTELEAIKTLRKIRRRHTFGQSKLAPYRAELVQLRLAGGSLGDLTLWLRKKKRIKADRSTLMRYLNKLPEMAEYLAQHSSPEINDV